MAKLNLHRGLPHRTCPAVPFFHTSASDHRPSRNGILFLVLVAPASLVENG